jgi:hypothetical protein
MKRSLPELGGSLCRKFASVKDRIYAVCMNYAVEQTFCCIKVIASLHDLGTYQAVRMPAVFNAAVLYG